MERDQLDLQEPAYEMMAGNTDSLRNKYFNMNLGLTHQFHRELELPV